jgi:hypothetical protein
MAIRNNTTSLGMGGGPRLTARSFNDMTARSISTEVARSNYRKSFRSNFKLAELRNYVYKMVSSWSKEDKMAILAQYGDLKGVMRSGGKNINEQLTETLIIRLKEEDLQVLLRDIRSDEMGLARKVRGIRNSQRRMASTFSTKSFEDVYNMAKDTRNNRGIERAVRQYDNSFRIPRRVMREFPTLRRELQQVIPEIYDRVEMAGLAHRMGIEFEDNIRQRDLVRRIINKTLLYVALIMGRTNASYSSAILQPEPYKELLQYTTYSWVAGSSGMSRDNVTTLRQEALNAKRMARERFTRRPQGLLGRIGRSALSAIPSAIMGTLNVFNPFSRFDSIQNRFMRGANTPYDFLGGLMGFGSPNEARLRRGGERVAQRANYTNNARYQRLMGMTPQDLLQEGTRLGLPTVALNTPQDRDRYARRIMALSERDNLRLDQLNRRAERRSRSWFGPKTLSAADEAERQALTAKERGTEGTSLPYITFSNSGVVNQADYAIRVFVVNPYFGNVPDDDTSNLPMPKVKAPFTTNIKDSTQNIDYKYSGLELYRSDKKSAYNTASGVFPYFNNDPKDPFVAIVNKPRQAMNINGAMAIRVFDQSNIILAQAMERRIEADKAKPGKAGLQKNLINSLIFSMGVKMVKREAASPVYVVNKNPIPTDAGAILKTVVKMLANFVLPGIGGAIAENLMMGIDDQGGIDSLLSIAGLASGGKGRGLPRFAQGTKRSNVSHFIAGDSLNGKPNEEQVSIDWTKKEFKVKPIPSMSGQELNKTGISQASKMSSAERSEPMKVFAVNPGIADLVELGSAKVSLIGLVADMVGRLSNIENLLSVGNQQSSAIVTATAATAANINKLATKTSSGANPFAGGFPSDLDSILTGR